MYPASLKSRPRLELIPRPVDKLLEALGWIALAALWAFVIISYSSLPGNIAIHFNAAGEPDNYGHKSALFLLPCIGSVVFAGLSFLNRYPHVMNYPVNITEENARAMYSNATTFIRYLKLALCIIFIMIAWLSYSSAFHNVSTFSIWMLPLMLAIIFIPLLFFIYRSSRVSPVDVSKDS